MTIYMTILQPDIYCLFKGSLKFKQMIVMRWSSDGFPATGIPILLLVQRQLSEGLHFGIDDFSCSSPSV